MRIAAALLALLALTLSGCESSQEKSAKLEKVAKVRAAEEAKHRPRGLSITDPSRLVRVESAAIVRSREGTAAVVTLRNASARSLRNVPIEITVKDAHGATVYANTAPGLGATLVSVPLLPAHATITWVDDQVQPEGTPAAVTATVGEGQRLAGAPPRLSVSGTHLSEGQAEGVVTNHSQVAQRELVVFAVARRGAKIVAVGRALVPILGAGASEHFQLFFIGDPQGAKLELEAPARTVG